MEIVIAIVGTLVGATISALVSWLVAYQYYKRAGDELRAETGELRAETGELRAEAGELRAETGELRAEAGELRKLANLTLVVLTDPNARFKLVYDAAGTITGLKLELEARSTGAGM